MAVALALPPAHRVQQWISVLDRIAAGPHGADVKQAATWLYDDFARRLRWPRESVPGPPELHVARALAYIQDLAKHINITDQSGPQDFFQQWRLLVTLDMQQTHHFVADVVDATTLFPGTGIVNEVLIDEMVARTFSPMDLERISRTRSDVYYSKLMDQAWHALGRAMFRDRLTGQPLPGFERMGQAPMEQRPDNFAWRAQYLWFNYTLQWLAQQVKIQAVELRPTDDAAPPFDSGTPASFTPTDSGATKGAFMVPALYSVEFDRTAWNGLKTKHLARPALGLVDHPGAPVQVFTKLLNASWTSEQAPGVVLDYWAHYDIHAADDAERTVRLAQAYHRMAYHPTGKTDGFGTLQWVVHPQTGKGRYECAPAFNKRPLWVPDKTRVPNLEEAYRLYMAWMNEAQETRSRVFRYDIPLIQVADSGSPWSDTPAPVVGRLSLVATRNAPGLWQWALTYVNWSVIAAHVLAEDGRLQLPPVPRHGVFSIGASLFHPLDVLHRALRLPTRALDFTSADPMVFYDALDNFYVHTTLDVPFVTAQTTFATDKSRLHATEGQRGALQLRQLVRWFFDSAAEPTVPAVVQQYPDPYVRLLQLYPSLLNYRVYKNPLALLA